MLPALEDIFLVINNRFEEIETRLEILEKMAFMNEELVSVQNNSIFIIFKYKF